jgi:hypothetical protein
MDDKSWKSDDGMTNSVMSMMEDKMRIKLM